MGPGERAELRGPRTPEEADPIRKAQCQSRGAGPQEGAGLESRSSVVGSGAWVQVCVNNHAHSMLRYQGHVGASLVVGGVDVTGPQLYSVHPHGSYSRLPFTALGEHFCEVPRTLSLGPWPHVCPALVGFGLP